jgi:aminopeptidase-like protein
VTVRDAVVAVDPATAGRDMYDLIAELYPIGRSITGEGFRSTLDTLARHLDLAVHEVPSGTRVFDLDGAPRVEHHRRLRRDVGG